MTTPADELRAAAARLRALADMASPGTWERGGYGDYGWTVRLGDTDDSELGKANAAYIAAMGPIVGTALADWLASAAVAAEWIGPDPRAVAVARAINQSGDTDA
ncbi:hypothetical protein K378_01400 [Streptomyces sp. Amel2xB2]|uniref:hypothetical protein n=1 Tax=Streptomyces sp. Amel2xB2 TaxID=1305829 RepID=UPI000DBA2853|nr:hypothetical protein [Streptomyces sp. Amel2xB2]RAJ70235.1 hypothetical protein K378_01400 [Streptomyces sp. Amel2xB2]